MHVIRRRGWEIPEREATPEHIFLNRRALLARRRRRRAVAVASARHGAARLRRAGPDREPLSGQAQREIRARPAGDRREDQHQLQQFLRVRLDQDHRARRAGAEAAALDGQDRRHGREGADDRYRRPDPARCRWRSGSTACAASRPGRWRCRGRASRWRSWSSSRSRCRRRNTSGWKPSWIRRWRRGSASAGIRGPMWKG